MTNSSTARFVALDGTLEPPCPAAAAAELRHEQAPGWPSGRTVASEALLQGARCVQIAHHGTLYRLQATRLGKLILTK